MSFKLLDIFINSKRFFDNIKEEGLGKSYVTYLLTGLGIFINYIHHRYSSHN